MKYYSLNRNTPDVDFKTATLKGQAPDKGLYFPESIPVVDKSLLQNLPGFSHEEIGFRVMRPYTQDSIPDDVLFSIISETVAFPFPLVRVTGNIYSLELFHGPTLAFKDVGARFMSRCLGYFSRAKDLRTTVLVATSGDTGGAVASGFLGVEGVDVVILYPSGKVSPVQELQLTTCGQNITALEVEGSFDDCQAMVKEAFMDAELMARRNLTSANSINVARWLPQQLYYFFALRQWADAGHPPVIAVPSGNFGNICAGLLAHVSGLPVKHFIAACNSNDVVVDYLLSGHYHPRQAIPTISNAMDVGNPSNFVRLLELFGKDYRQITSLVSGYRVTDAQTMKTLHDLYHQHGYIADPHGAVAYDALETYLYHHPGQKGIFLETAHPVKFPDTVEVATGLKVPIPEQVRELFGKQKKSILIRPEFAALKEVLMGSVFSS